MLRACAPGGGSIVSDHGGTGHGLLDAGRYGLKIAFPPGSEARGEVRLRLVYTGPPKK